VPKSSEFNSILVAVYYLTKMAHFIPTKTTVDAVETGKLSIEKIFRLHGIPKAIVTGQASLLTSKFWNHLLKSLHTQLGFNTPFHPASYGRTERLTRTYVPEL